MRSDPFVAHRSLLFTVAYEMLGSAADAEDAVQEAWLRWANIDQATIVDPRAYLVRIVTRQALNRLRVIARRRETYVGEWLPEPLLTSADVAEDALLTEHISIAMLTVLETLAPTERAVFVLREVFATPYAEIAEAVDKTPAAVRQIAHRARQHVAARRPRMRVDRAEVRVAVDKFLSALSTGDVQAFLEVLAPDVVLIADGGGLVAAARKPIVGAQRVSTFLARGRALVPDFTLTPTWINGLPGARLDFGGITSAISLAVHDDHITRVYSVSNPNKLAWLQDVAVLRR